MSALSLAKRAAEWLPDSTQSLIRARVQAIRGDLRLFRALISDWRRYRDASGLLQNRSRQVVEARIIKTYHRIEKGLALAEPRAGFGRDALDLLKADVASYVSRFGADRSTRAALNVLSEYASFNESKGIDMRELSSFLARIECLHGDEHHSEGGTRTIERDVILALSKLDMRAFFASRHSVRQFSADPVDMGLVEAAVAMAQKTPSVCNREANRVYVIEDPAQRERLLAFQSGNRGFGDSADKILIVGSSLSCFHTVGERYQAWIDGGMFSMSLIYALHSLGLATCCLNWSVEPAIDRAFREAAGLSDDIQVIMLIAVGQLPATLRVAQSPRRPRHSVLQVLKTSHQGRLG